MKICSKCGIEKPLSEFHSAGHVRSDGTKYIRGECKTCQKKVVKRRGENIREQYVAWKKTLKCNRCGFDDYRALQFHHERDKEHNIAEMLRGGFALEKIKFEAEKCEILCANCHQIHHSSL